MHSASGLHRLLSALYTKRQSGSSSWRITYDSGRTAEPTMTIGKLANTVERKRNTGSA